MSNLRLSGLASGMDTDTMVQSLMKVERLKVDRYEQAKQISLWRQEAYNNMNKTFANFILNTRKDMGLTKTTSTGFSLGNSYTNLDYIRKATSSNESAASVSSTSKAVNGSYTIEVKELAKGASFTSAKLDENILKYTENGEVKNLKELEFTIGDTIIKVGDKNNNITMNDVVKAINSAKKKVGDKEVPIGVTAFYDEKNGRLFMQTTETGKDVRINLAATDDTNSKNFIEKLKSGIKQEGTVGADYAGAIYSLGKDAEITFNGIKLNYSSNNINLNGLNIELKAQGTTTIKVDTNIDGIMEKVEKLINDYNELVDKASKVIGEKRYQGYHPLSQEEKKAMHEDDAKLWEEKAKSGMLNRDETIQRALQNARNDLYKTLEGNTGEFNHITQIGITTEKYARGTAGGKLEIDKEKLRQAIEKDPEGVMELLFKESNEEPTKSDASTKGIFTRVYDNLIDGMKSIIDKSGPGQDSDLFRSVKSNILLDFVTQKSSISDLDKEVLDANKRIDDLNAMLYRKENAYYAKFANMEKMLQQMYSQSNWLSQQLG